MRIVVPTDVSEVTEALKTMLIEAPNVGGNDTVIERAEQFTEETYLNGWVGIYKSGRKFVPRAIGVAPGFRYDNIELILVVKYDSNETGTACENGLEALIKEIISIILSDTTIGGTVANVDGETRVQYDSYTKEDSVFTQRAYIFLALQTTTGVKDQ